MRQESRDKPQAPKEIEKKKNIPVYPDNGQDYRHEWTRLLGGDNEELPFEATFANQFFDWPHEIKGELRRQFDCTDPDSYRLIPPKDYLAAYHAAKKRGEI